MNQSPVTRKDVDDAFEAYRRADIDFQNAYEERNVRGGVYDASIKSAFEAAKNCHSLAEMGYEEAKQVLAACEYDAEVAEKSYDEDNADIKNAADKKQAKLIAEASMKRAITLRETANAAENDLTYFWTSYNHSIKVLKEATERLSYIY